MTQNLYQILPKVLYVTSKKKENSRLRLRLSTPHPSSYSTFYHSLLFFLLSPLLRMVCVLPILSLSKVLLSWDLLPKSIKCAFPQWNGEGYILEERALNIFSF